MIKKIYIAAGCFWGTEAYFKKVKGILNTKVGYANGKTDKTSYKELDVTDHVETVELEYDSNIINLAEIIERFLLIVNPFSLNRQGNDIGRQYRSGIYYLDDFSYKTAKFVLDIFQKNQTKKVLVELQKLNNFIPAEEYHQDYLTKNPTGYCHLDLSIINKPMTDYLKKSIDEINKLNLDKETLGIMLNKDTEYPHTSIFNKNEEIGLYIDIISNQPLFSSEDKFDAGCGWPSFTKPIHTDSILYEDDFSIKNRPRIEVLSSVQEAHLGHVFSDGPVKQGGLRYCINGKTLKFIKLQDLFNTEYERYLPYFSEYVNSLWVIY